MLCILPLFSQFQSLNGRRLGMSELFDIFIFSFELNHIRSVYFWRFKRFIFLHLVLQICRGKFFWMRFIGIMYNTFRFFTIGIITITQWSPKLFFRRLITMTFLFHKLLPCRNQLIFLSINYRALGLKSWRV